MILWQFIRFVTVGLINTAVGLFVIYAFKWGFGFGDIQSNFLGYAVGILISFWLNARYTFGFAGERFKAVVRFMAVSAAAYLLNLITVLYAIHGRGIHGDIAQLAGVVPYILFSFLLSRYWVFVTNTRGTDIRHVEP